jgi:hypothetical protein
MKRVDKKHIRCFTILRQTPLQDISCGITRAVVLGALATCKAPTMCQPRRLYLAHAVSSRDG